jgi:hypothetical protein
MAFKRASVSSSGGGGDTAFTFLARGCLTILAVEKATKRELAGVLVVAVLNFI